MSESKTKLVNEYDKWELRRKKFIEIQLMNSNLHVEAIIINAMKINGYGNISIFDIYKSSSIYDGSKKKKITLKNIRQLFFERIKKR